MNTKETLELLYTNNEYAIDELEKEKIKIIARIEERMKFSDDLDCAISKIDNRGN